MCVIYPADVEMVQQAVLRDNDRTLNAAHWLREFAKTCGDADPTGKHYQLDNNCTKKDIWKIYRNDMKVSPMSSDFCSYMIYCTYCRIREAAICA
jgi:hypothetical protein